MGKPLTIDQAEAEAKWEEYRLLFGIVPLVTYLQALVIVDLERGQPFCGRAGIGCVFDGSRQAFEALMGGLPLLRHGLP